MSPRPSAGTGPGRTAAPRPPPTREAIQALATREHVPARIARGELQGKMRARIWRKLHADEAKRFDEVYALMARTPGLELPDAFGLLQSGLPLEDFQARRARAQRKTEVKEARGSVPADAVDGFLATLAAEHAPLAVVLGERTLLDALVSVQPVAFSFERSGRVEKLQVVLLCRQEPWEGLQPTLQRDTRSAHKPIPVAREPDKRPVSDPRPFRAAVGRRVRLSLRNGISLTQPLTAVGPFDLLLGASGEELFVPLHALTAWELEAG